MVPAPEPRLATRADLAAIQALEESAFEPARRSSRRSLAHALQRPNQSVWVLDDGGVVASMVLWHFPRSLRIYGLAVDPAKQGHGHGRRMLRAAEEVARERGNQRLLLECTDGLVDYYARLGYVRQQKKPDFYGPGLDAWRLVKEVA